MDTDSNSTNSNSQFDAKGNTVSFNAVNFTYDWANRLLTQSSPAVTIVYDADGNRIKKTVGGTTRWFLIATVNPTGYPQVVEELTGTTPTTLGRRYTYGLDLISQASGTTSLFFGTDGLGSTRFLLDTSGVVVENYAYDAYGNLITSGTPGTAYLYSGEQWDSDLGMYYLRARYLNPALGRFWTADTFEGSQNDPLSLHKYAYASANPVNRVDPSGFISSLDAAKYGRMIHEKLGKDFMDKMEPFGISGSSIGTSLRKYGINVDAIIALLPDLVDINPANKEVYEIKPIGSAIWGEAQPEGYLQVFNYFDPVKTWKPGNTYMPPLEVTLDPLTYAIVSPPVRGVIIYTLFSVKDFAKKRALNVAESQSADIQESVGISTLTTLVGF